MFGALPGSGRRDASLWLCWRWRRAGYRRYCGSGGIVGVTMLKRLLRVDDPCDVFGVHGVLRNSRQCLTGVLPPVRWAALAVDGVTMGHQVMVQLEVLLIRSSGRCCRVWLQNWRDALDCVCTGRRERGAGAEQSARMRITRDCAACLMALR